MERRAATFDRVRPRDVAHRASRPRTVGAADPQGKRALFSATAPVASRPGPGSVVIDCSGCQQRSVVSPIAAVRAALPSLVLGLTLAHGEQSRDLGLRARGQSAWLRCPACRKRRWVRLTLTV